MTLLSPRLRATLRFYPPYPNPPSSGLWQPCSAPCSFCAAALPRSNILAGLAAIVVYDSYMAQAMFEVACPCCQAILKIDPETRAVIAHTIPVKPPSIEDLAAEVA